MDHNRKQTTCLHADLLASTLAHEMIWLRSEQLPSFSDYYVDAGNYVDNIDNNSSHLVSGRRGTGKTHLLGTLKERVNQKSNFECAVMISLLDVSKSISPIVSEASIVGDLSRITSNDLFLQFLRRFFDEFLEVVDSRLSAVPARVKDVVYSKLQSLLTEIESGQLFAEDSELEDRGGGSVAISRSRVGQAVHIVGDPLPTKRKSQHSTGSSGTVNFARVRKLTNEILERTNIPLLHILVDEWMELDKNAPSKIQNYFSQMLKKTFMGSKRISVVIASVWNQTSLYERADMAVSSGIQVGQDINHTVDLDTTFLENSDQIVRFCKELLFIRLKNAEPNFDRLRLDDGTISEVLITDIFDSIENFKVLVTASHGIPREFMKLFGKATLRIKNNYKTKCLNHALLLSVSRDLYLSEKRETIMPGTPTQAMWARINEYMYKSGRRFFVIANSSQKTSTAFRALIDHELIHEVPSKTLPRWVRRDHKAYMIDFGNFVDWKSQRAGDIDDLIKESILPDWAGLTEADLGTLRLDPILDHDIFFTCPHCRSSVDRSHAIFRKARLCTNCAEPIDKNPMLAATKTRKLARSKSI